MPTFDYSLLKRTDLNGLDNGESTMTRGELTSTPSATTSGKLALSFFTATKSETINNVRAVTADIAAAATPTLCRIGIYSVDPVTKDLTLVASTANDTTLFAAIDTTYTKALSAPLYKNKGQRYAVGVLIVSAAAMPTLIGKTYRSPANEAFMQPHIVAALSGQSDLPATISDSSLAATSVNPYFAVTP